MVITHKNTLVPKVLDLVRKYHTLEPTCVAQLTLTEHWSSIPKVAGSIPTVVRQTFQPGRCGYTLRVTSEDRRIKHNNIRRYKDKAQPI